MSPRCLLRDCSGGIQPAAAINGAGMVTSPSGWSKGIGFDAMTCEARTHAARTAAGSTNTPPIRIAALALCAVLLAGCSSASIGSPNGPSYLGARDIAPPAKASNDTSPRVTSSKVLSAVVFERVTGLEVDPARLIDR